ncbi:hypothetical protein BJ973_001670 [Actinoplanes tereljensis]|uniref:Uncharacterized protein n=1 Tax=Paractinoplanes tereljensis TaxID=571912 RepID=A0A919NM12_9ACTN|nr:hypothetical protein [Actinoplanes tereljensis]GIF20426.1 hypothetical protein Ate02nite_31560 [Actinoplanes tereljensis]
MIDLPHEPSGLEKATWTAADFAVMGWHDCRVRAISVGEYEDGTLPPARVLLDLDYIVRWVHPAADQEPFTFWVFPATLVFDGASDITGELGPLHEVLEIADIHRGEQTDGEPSWHVEGQNFDLRLRAAGYTQYLRRAPLHVPRMMLTSAERGGISFDERAFA